MKKKKILLITAGLAIATSTFAITSCSTSWIHWKTKDDGGRSTYDPSKHHTQATPSQYQVRYHSLADFEKAGIWDKNTQTLNFSGLNNHYEFFELFGLLTQLKYTTSIDTNWKLEDWPKFADYLKQVQSNLTINVVDQGQFFGSINIDFSTIKEKIILALDLNTYKPNPDPKRPASQGKSGKDFDLAKQYDVEYHGLNPQGLPVDFSGVAQAGGSLSQNPSVSALLSIDQQFALSLSKLVNIPKAAFANFASLLAKMNETFNNIIFNTGFQNWLVEKGVDFNISADGKIPNPEDKNISTLFKGKMLDTILNNK